MKILLSNLTLWLSLAAVAVAQTSGTVSKETVKLEGQVVCSKCWYDADRTLKPFGTPEDLTCEVSCADADIPAALAVKNQNGEGWTLYILDEGKFKKPAKHWLDYMAKQVEIVGETQTKQKQPLLKVNALKVLSPPNEPAKAQSANVLGSEAELALKDPYGVEQKLSALRGRIVVVNFWATWCGPCKKEMPDLVAIQNQYATLGVQVIGASADTLEAKKEVLQFARETKLNFPVWLGATTAEMARFGLGPGLPATAIIGRDGKIVAVFQGVIKKADLIKQLDALLAFQEGESKDLIAAQDHQPENVSSVPS